MSNVSKRWRKSLNKTSPFYFFFKTPSTYHFLFCLPFLPFLLLKLAFRLSVFRSIPMSSLTLWGCSHPGLALVLSLPLFKVAVHQASYNAFVSIILISPPLALPLFPLSFDFALLSPACTALASWIMLKLLRGKEAAPAQIKYTKHWIIHGGYACKEYDREESSKKKKPKHCL